MAKSLFFADAISYSDYKAEKEEFQRKNKERDQLFSFKENITIPGFETDIMVRINGNSKLCSGIGFYILWTIIPFVEFYKLYFKRKIFKLRKLPDKAIDFPTLFSLEY